MKKFRVGIIGAGDIAVMHAQAYGELAEECELVAIADTDEDRARRLAEAAGTEVETFADYCRLLEREDIDVVSVCTPPYVREAPIVAALAAGKHVMAEKPLAASLEECDAMLGAAAKHNRKLAVMLQTRFELSVRQIRHLVASGAIGAPLFASAANHHWRGERYYGKPWRGTWERERGGVLMNLGIHTLDVLLWTLGELSSVRADMATLGNRIETEDAAAASLKFACGALAQFVCTTTHPVDGSSLEISGRSRMVRYPLSFAAYAQNDAGYPMRDAAAEVELAQAADAYALAAEEVTEGFAGPIRDLFAAIREDREPITGGLSVRRTIEAVTAIYKSAATGAEVRLPIGRDDACYTTEGLHRLMKTIK